jgi:hypothetical protein
MDRPPKRIIAIGFTNSVVGGVGVALSILYTVILSAETLRSGSTPRIAIGWLGTAIMLLGGIAVFSVMLLSGVGLLGSRRWARGVACLFCVASSVWAVLYGPFMYVEFGRSPVYSEFTASRYQRNLIVVVCVVVAYALVTAWVLRSTRLRTHSGYDAQCEAEMVSLDR